MTYTGAPTSYDTIRIVTCRVLGIDALTRFFWEKAFARLHRVALNKEIVGIGPPGQ